MQVLEWTTEVHRVHGLFLAIQVLCSYCVLSEHKALNLNNQSREPHETIPLRINFISPCLSSDGPDSDGNTRLWSGRAAQ